MIFPRNQLFLIILVGCLFLLISEMARRVSVVDNGSSSITTQTLIRDYLQRNELLHQEVKQLSEQLAQVRQGIDQIGKKESYSERLGNNNNNNNIHNNPSMLWKWRKNMNPTVPYWYSLEDPDIQQVFN